MPSWTSRVSLLAVAVTVAIIAVILLLGQCDKRRSEAAQSRVEREQTGALSNSAADAIDAVGAAGGRETASEQLTRDNEKEIRNAPGADQAVDPRARDAGLASLCRRPAYAGSERCQLLRAAPR